MADAIADLGFVHIESVAAMLEKQKGKKAQHYGFMYGSALLAKAIAELGMDHIESAVTAIEERNEAREKAATLSEMFKQTKWTLQRIDVVMTERDEALAKCADLQRATEQLTYERNEARYEKNEALTMRDDLQRKLKLSMTDGLQKHKAIVKLTGELNFAEAQSPDCLNCGSSKHVWYFNNGESAYCSECSPTLYQMQERGGYSPTQKS